MPRLSDGRYKVTKGRLAGRIYKSESNYRNALARDRGFRSRYEERSFWQRKKGSKKPDERSLAREERYKSLMELFIDFNGLPDKKQRARFNELYSKAKKKQFDNCPPAAGAKENEAPFAYLLDFIGARPLDQYGFWCIGDTPEA